MVSIASPSAAENSLISRFLAGLQPKTDIPLRLALWNGLQHDFGPQPRVTVNLHGPGAFRYFLPPSLDNMAEGYVNGHFDIQGRVQDIVDAAVRLAHIGVPMRGRFGRLFSALRLARARVVQAGLTEQVKIRLLDYRDIDERDGQFDKITSIGMFEHVGLSHLTAYFAKINALLKDGGLLLNHGITSTDPGSGATPLGAASFIEKYVFPNGELPHISLALQTLQAAGLESLDIECLRRHYARTLAIWSDNYETQSDTIRTLVDETTYRVWRIYLAGCAHAFTQNWVSLYQVLACKAGTSEQLNPTPWSRAYMYA